MLTLFALALSVGLVDSVNPSTVGPALYLATGEHAARRVALFTLGAFGVSVAGGIALALGPGQAMPHPGNHTVHVLEVAVGAAALVGALVLWQLRERIGGHLRHGAEQVGRAPLLLGAGIMLAELPTAVPYFGVIAAIAGSGRSYANQVLALLLFNAAFVAPLLAILGLRSLAGDRSAHVLESWRDQIDRRGATVIPVLVLVLGIVLIVLGLT